MYVKTTKNRKIHLLRKNTMRNHNQAGQHTKKMTVENLSENSKKNITDYVVTTIKAGILRQKKVKASSPAQAIMNHAKVL